MSYPVSSNYHPAHAVRPADPADALAVIATPGLRSFTIRTAAFVTAAGVQACILIRMENAAGAMSWRFAPIDAAVLAITVQLSSDLPTRDLIASALRRSVHDAETRVAEVHALQRTSLQRAALRAADAPTVH